MDSTKFKAIIYDGDGMVINAEMFYLKLLRELGSKAEILNEFYANAFQLCLIGKADLKEEIAPYLTKLGWKGNVDDFLAYWFENEKKVDAKIIYTIKQLKEKGMEIYLASNQEKYRTDYLIEKMEFDDIFDRIFFSSQVGYLKPQREFFDYIISYLSERKINKEEILFWDDREKNVKLAREYGLTAELYKNYADYEKIMKKYGLLLIQRLKIKM